MSLEYRIGDVFDRIAEIPDGTIDLIVTSPPFLALRSYLPADHPDKRREIGSEATPADFLDTLLVLTAEWGRVLAPHGSLCVELGDTYSGANDTGWHRSGNEPVERYRNLGAVAPTIDRRNGWPLAKSLTGIPTLYPWSLAYGRNLLTGQPSPAGQWRIRNLIVWGRPNPPVGALGDKFRPATSYITVACRGAKRYFDLDAVRGDVSAWTAGYADRFPVSPRSAAQKGLDGGSQAAKVMADTNGQGINQQGAPPLDWHTDLHPEDGDWLWKMATAPYAGAHYACYPYALPKRLIEAMCPLRVCTVCGRPSERIVGEAEYVSTNGGRVVNQWAGDRRGEAVNSWDVAGGNPGHAVRSAPTVGWSDCGCCVRAQGGSPGKLLTLDDCLDVDHWRTGIVLDPFAGSGTTLEAAQAVGRHAIGIDLDSRNADLARERVGMFLEISA